jgi:hypothetical protein
MNSLILPISYIGGSGGNFFASWLNNAAHGYEITFSNHGNVHTNKYSGSGSIFSNPHEIFDDIQKTATHAHPHFYAVHIVNDEFLLANFAKVCKITCCETDKYDIATNFYAKWFLDSENNATLTTPSEFISNRITRVDHIYTLMSFSLPENNQSTNVSWRDLVYSDSNTLISRMSQFYKISSSKFNCAALNHWRSLTLNNILMFGDKI